MQTTNTGHAGPIALGNEVKRLVDHGNRVEQIRADVEQIARLKEAASAALENIQGIMNGTDIPSLVVRDMLRVALTPVDESQIQCADCLAWIDTNNNHTCKQQIRRNRRRE